jgi:protein TonB
MTGRGDLLLAFAAATAVHAGVFLAGSNSTGGGGAGSAGSDRVSVEAASPAVTALVREWNAPPRTSDVSALKAPAPAAETPDLPELADAPQRTAAPAEPVMLHVPDIAPRVAALIPEAAPGNFKTEAPPVLTQSRETRPAPVLLSRLPVGLDPRPDAIDTAPPAPDIAPRLTERPTPRPEQAASPAVARRVASGIGDGGIRGAARQEAAPKLSEDARRAAASAWAVAIQKRIARHHAYPRGTTREGRVRVAMVILPSGHLDRVSVARSSGTAELDEAALAAVKRAAPFPPAPEALDDKWFDVGQWISFERR